MGDDFIAAELDGMGGGFGKNQGKTVREISEQFSRIAAEPSMRSFRAILRIAREQIEARGQLSQYRWMFVGTLVLTVGCGIGYLVSAGQVRDTLEKLAIACLVATAAFGFGLLSTRQQTRASVAQERAIRDLAVDALSQIAATPGFEAKPLDFTLFQFLQELLKKTKRTEPGLSAVLALGEE